MSADLKKLTPGKFACTCHFQQIGINATKIETMGIHFKTDVVATVAAVDTKAPSVISRGNYVSGHVVPASSPPKCLDRDCVGRRRTGTRPGNVYRSVREKIGTCCLLATCFTNSDISACCFTSVSRARPPENRKYLSPARSHTFALETSREIKYATMSEFSTFLKSSNSGEQFLLRLTLFYPIYG